jgi:TPR repeat protein
VPEDQFKAVEFFRRACDGDHGRGCANLAWRYSIGVGIEKSDEMEMVLTKRACDLDDGIGCGNLAILVGDSDPEEQTRLYEKACKLGRIRACVHYVYHVVEKVDPKKAARAYEDLCEKGESEGCHFRASLALRKEGNLELGKAFAEKSCVHANFRGCRLLADAYQGKFGGTPDYTEANRLYEIACTHRVHAVRGACLSWADNIEKGYGVPADPERARELRERATQLSR